MPYTRAQVVLYVPFILYAFTALRQQLNWYHELYVPFILYAFTATRRVENDSQLLYVPFELYALVLDVAVAVV